MAIKIKITGINFHCLKVIKDLGLLTGFMGAWEIAPVIGGGGSFFEIQTDQGLTGIGPRVDPV
jgi:hypothetical protein